MFQTGHDPHGFNPVNYQRHYNWARSCLLYQQDNNGLLINANTQGTILISYVSSNQIIQQCNQNRVLILTDLIYKIYTLHVKF